jgi:hypothetical protein
MPLTVDERKKLIAQYQAGYGEVIKALEGATEAELDRRPAPEKWSSREIVHHLADSEMTSAIRLRRLIAEDQPVIQGYDEAEYARRLHYDRPIEASLQAFGAARACTVPFLERLTPAEWERVGTHSESGAYSVDNWLQIYAVHAHNHADQIRRARAAVSR